MAEVCDNKKKFVHTNKPVEQVESSLCGSPVSLERHSYGSVGGSGIWSVGSTILSPTRSIKESVFELD